MLLHENNAFSLLRTTPPSRGDLLRAHSLGLNDGDYAVVFILLCALLFIATSFWIWRRAPRKRRIWRVLANTLAILALLALALRPRWISAADPATAVLLTSGAENYRATPSYDAPPNAAYTFALAETQLKPNESSSCKIIPDLGYLHRHYPEVRRLYVFGHGLREYDWQELEGVQITPDFAPLSTGFQQVYWPRELQLGQAFFVQGEAVCGDSAKHWVTLTDPGGESDSLALTPKPSPQFELQMRPRELGLHLYVLRLKSEAGRVLAEEHLAVHVQPPQPLRILILESAPKFETKHLKHWAAREQCRLAIRTTVSRERHRFEFINHPRLKLAAIDAEVLEDFDVVLLDGHALETLSAQERRALRAAMERKGVGVLLVADEVTLAPEQQNFSEAKFFLPFRFEAFPDLESRMVKAHWQHSPTQTSRAIPCEPFALMPSWGGTALVSDEQDRALAMAVQRGEGRVGLSLLRETYRWLLTGQPQLYASYWSHVFSALARRKEQREAWALAVDKPICVDQPLALQLTTTNPLPFGIIKPPSAPADTFFLRQDEVEPQRWRGTYWPRESGWHEVATKWFYVYAREDWRTWQQAARIAATSRRAVRSNERTSSPVSSTFAKTEIISPFWFFLIFLLSSTFLWLERKL